MCAGQLGAKVRARLDIALDRLLHGTALLCCQGAVPLRLVPSYVGAHRSAYKLNTQWLADTCRSHENFIPWHVS